MNDINLDPLISTPQPFHTIAHGDPPITQRSGRILVGKLQDKVAVITGATSGMALATAKRFVREGAYVFITGRRQKELDSAVAAIGRSVTGVQGDASNLADIDRLYHTVKDQKGHIDVLYASAGLGEFNIPLGMITEESFAKTFDLNVRGTLFTVQDVYKRQARESATMAASSTSTPLGPVSCANTHVSQAAAPYIGNARNCFSRNIQVPGLGRNNSCLLYTSRCV